MYELIFRSTLPTLNTKKKRKKECSILWILKLHYTSYTYCIKSKIDDHFSSLFHSLVPILCILSSFVYIIFPHSFFPFYLTIQQNILRITWAISNKPNINVSIVCARKMVFVKIVHWKKNVESWSWKTQSTNICSICIKTPNQYYRRVCVLCRWIGYSSSSFFYHVFRFCIAANVSFELVKCLVSVYIRYT